MDRLSGENGRDYLEDRTYTQAEAMLSGVALRVSDIEKYKGVGSVVDLGCGDAQIAKSVALRGNNSVISIANITPRNIQGIDFRKMDALEGIDLPPDTVKLLVSLRGPHLWTQNQAQAEKLVSEVNRILSVDGEARMSVPWFGFIQTLVAERLKNSDKRQEMQSVWRRLSKPTDWHARTNLMTANQQKIEAALPYLRQARDESVQFLKDLGYNAQLAHNPQQPENEKLDFILLKKTKF